MDDNMDKFQKRKNIRLTDYDYSQPGYYFVTICTKNKEKVLSNIKENILKLSLIGNEINNTINFIQNQNTNIIFNKFVIMPNHIHAIVILKDSNAGRDGTLPLHKIIGQLKSYTNKKYNEIKNSTNLILWQRNYYEHIIRNEIEYQEIWKYIDINPLEWEEDKYYI